jgi:hypothetical protein
MDQATQTIAPIAAAAKPMKIGIRTSYLRAAALFAPKKDIRHYLNGVELRIRTDGTYVLSATDGHAAARIKSDYDIKASGPMEAVMILPIDFVQKIAKAKPFDVELEIGAEFEAEKGLPPQREVKAAAQGALCTTIADQFPDLPRVWPETLTGEIAQFDPEILARFSKARTEITGGTVAAVSIGHNGSGTALVCIGCPDLFSGVVMPYRADAINPDAHAWAKQA